MNKVFVPGLQKPTIIISAPKRQWVFRRFQQLPQLSTQHQPTLRPPCLAESSKDSELVIWPPWVSPIWSPVICFYYLCHFSSPAPTLPQFWTFPSPLWRSILARLKLPFATLTHKPVSTYSLVFGPKRLVSFPQRCPWDFLKWLGGGKRSPVFLVSEIIR